MPRASFARATVPKPEAISKIAENALTPDERLLLLSDVWASVAVNREPIGDYLVLAEGLRKDSNSAVLNELFKQIGYIHDYLVTDADRKFYEMWEQQLLPQMSQEIGWKPQPGESEEQAKLRAELMTALGGVAGDPPVLALARKISGEYLADPNSVNPEMAAVALRVSAGHGDEMLF